MSQAPEGNPEARTLGNDTGNGHGNENQHTSIGRKLVGVEGTPLNLHGVAQVQIQLEDEVFMIAAIVADTLATGIDVILGRDFLREHHCTIEMGQKNDVLRFKNNGISIVFNSHKGQPQDSKVSVMLTESLHVPPHSEIEVMARVPSSAANQTWVVEADKQQRSAVMVARAVVTPGATEIPLCLLNWRNEAVSIPKGTVVAAVELVADDACATETVVATGEPFRFQRSNTFVCGR